MSAGDLEEAAEGVLRTGAPATEGRVGGQLQTAYGRNLTVRYSTELQGSTTKMRPGTLSRGKSSCSFAGQFLSADMIGQLGRTLPSKPAFAIHDEAVMVRTGAQRHQSSPDSAGLAQHGDSLLAPIGEVADEQDFLGLRGSHVEEVFARFVRIRAHRQVIFHV